MFVRQSIRDPQKTFNSIESRTENTEKGVTLFDRASSDRYLASSLRETSSLFLEVMPLCSRITGGIASVTDIVDAHPEPS